MRVAMARKRGEGAAWQRRYGRRKDRLERIGEAAVKNARRNLEAPGGTVALSNPGYPAADAGRFPHTATETTIGTIAYEVEQLDSGTWRLTVKAGGAAKWLEYGVSQGQFPNVDAIRDWAETKFAFPLLATWAGAEEGETVNADQFAYLVGRQIAENGLSPTYFLSNAIEEARIAERARGKSK